MPFLIGLNFVLMALKSGRISGSSAQHSFKQSRTKSKLFSSASNGGLITKNINYNRSIYKRERERESSYRKGGCNGSRLITFCKICACVKPQFPKGP